MSGDRDQYDRHIEPFKRTLPWLQEWLGSISSQPHRIIAARDYLERVDRLSA